MAAKSKNPDAAVLGQTGDCACLNLRMAARAVTQMFDGVLKPAGLKATQFSVLAAVAVQGPASMTAVAQSLVMDRTTLTRNLQPLIDRGLVRVDAGGDKRERAVQLTEAGKKVLATALPLWKQAQDRIVGGIGFARWSGVQRMLEESVRIAR